MIFGSITLYKEPEVIIPKSQGHVYYSEYDHYERVTWDEFQDELKRVRALGINIGDKYRYRSRTDGDVLTVTGIATYQTCQPTGWGVGIIECTRDNGIKVAYLFTVDELTKPDVMEKLPNEK